MDIREIMRSNSSSQQLFIVSAQDLIDVIDTSVKKTIQELMGNMSMSNKRIPLEEVAKTLNVSRSTLNRWNKNGYLKNFKIGKKVFYYQSDINNIR